MQWGQCTLLIQQTGQPDPLPYNLAKWNGSSWQLKKVTVNFRGYPVTTPIDGIFAFSPTDIWLVAGDPIHGDGKNWSDFDIRNITGDQNIDVLKGWGTSSSNIYFVGRNGNIVHYNGSSWTKIESGTSLEFLDIYGATDNTTGEQQILAVCSENYPLGEAIFSISGNTATKISSNPLSQYELFSVWFVPNQHYYVVGSGIYEKNSLSDSTWKNYPTEFTHYASSEIRGSGLNDIFVVGAFGEFLHWNGASWKSFITETGFPSGSYGSVAVKGDLVITVGYNSPQAVITMGRRQQ